MRIKKVLVTNLKEEGLIGFGLGTIAGGGQAIVEGGIQRTNNTPTASNIDIDALLAQQRDMDNKLMSQIPPDVDKLGVKAKMTYQPDNVLMRQLFPDNVLMRQLFPETNSAEPDLNALANDAGKVYNNTQGSEVYYGETQNNRSQSGFSGIEEIYRGLSEGAPDAAAGGAGNSTENNGQIQEQIGFPSEMGVAGFGNELSGLRNTPDDLLGVRGHVLSPVESEALRRSGIDPESVRDVSQSSDYFTQSLKENAASQRFGACVDTDYTATDLLGSRLYTNKDGTITVGVKPDGDIFALAKRAMEDILEYSIQLAMLRQLLSEKLINKQEYFKIKKLLMKKYKISSDLTC